MRRRLAAPMKAAAQGAAGTRRGPASGPLSELSVALEGLSAKVSPGVVQILTTGYATVGAGNGGVLTKQRATGSGVILDASGYIVTNHHVVQGARRIQVVLAGPPSPSPHASVLKPRGPTVGAQLVGTDPDTALAVIKVEGTGLPILSLGDSEGLRQGQIVLAFGAPLGLDNGARAQTITPALAAGLGLSRTEGVIVSDVNPFGGASKSGLELGDIIVALDGKRMENGRPLEVNLYRRAPGQFVAFEVVNKELVGSVEGLRTAASKLKPGDPVVLLVERQGELLYLAAELE